MSCVTCSHAPRQHTQESPSAASSLGGSSPVSVGVRVERCGHVVLGHPSLAGQMTLSFLNEWPCADQHLDTRWAPSVSVWGGGGPCKGKPHLGEAGHSDQECRLRHCHWGSRGGQRGHPSPSSWHPCRHFLFPSQFCCWWQGHPSVPRTPGPLTGAGRGLLSLVGFGVILLGVPEALSPSALVNIIPQGL